MNKTRLIRRYLLTLSLALLALAVPITSAQEDRLQIVASHSILADVVQNVAGDAADVTSVMAVGSDPHSFQPVPSDLIALAEADVVFTNGALFEEGLLEAIENAGTDMNIFEASACVEIIAFGAEDHAHEEGEETATTSESDTSSEIATRCAEHYAEMEALHSESAEEETDEEHDHHVETLGALYTIDCGADHTDGEETDEEHDHGACDPHVWMEPHNVMYWTMLIRDTLIELDPANAETYTADASAYLTELDALIHDFMMPMIATLPEENRILITNHDTLGYFAAAYDFQIIGTVIPGGSTVIEPSAQDVVGLINIIQEQGVPAIFSETTVSSTLIETVAAETGAGIYTLYSGSLSTEDEPASTYLDYMRYNVTTIVEALGGGM